MFFMKKNLHNKIHLTLMKITDIYINWFTQNLSGVGRCFCMINLFSNKKSSIKISDNEETGINSLNLMIRKQIMIKWEEKKSKDKIISVYQFSVLI